MKKFKLIASISMLSLCLLIITVGVFASNRQSSKFSGSVTLEPIDANVAMTGYVNGENIMHYDTVIGGITWTEGLQGLKFDMSKANTSVDQVPTIDIKIHLKNNSPNKQLGAYFYTGTGLDENEQATKDSIEVYREFETNGVVWAKAYLTSYSHMYVANDQNDHDEIDMLITIKATSLTHGGTINFDFNLNVEEYVANQIGTSSMSYEYPEVLKLAYGETRLYNLEETQAGAPDHVFQNKSNVHYIVCPATVTAISNGEQSLLQNLRGVSLTKYVTSIDNTFSDYYDIENRTLITYPNWKTLEYGGVRYVGTGFNPYYFAIERINDNQNVTLHKNTKALCFSYSKDAMQGGIPVYQKVMVSITVPAGTNLVYGATLPEFSPCYMYYSDYGWYNFDPSIDIPDKSLKVTQIVASNQDLTYYSCVGEIATVTFYANDGMIPEGEYWTGSGEEAIRRVWEDTLLKHSPIPTREGYTFAGWKDRNSGNIVTNSTKIGNDIGLANLHLDAQWTAN